jgi:hypothetical protein
MRYGLRYGSAQPSTDFQRLTCRPPLLSCCKVVSVLFFHGGNAGSNPAGDANKRKELAGLVFVDANIWLDFYRVRNDTGLRLLEHSEALADKLIVTYQHENEYKRNRQAAIFEGMQALKAINSGLQFSHPASGMERSLDDLPFATGVNEGRQPRKGWS